MSKENPGPKPDYTALLGQRFNMLTIIKQVENLKSRYVTFLCVCDCGKTITCELRRMKCGNTKSCGCLRIINHPRTHGFSGTATYHCWSSMTVRCKGQHKRSRHRYAERGITVCDRWKLFANFLEDMGERPEGHTLDRIDNDKGYEPGNCRWATVAQQNRNKSDNRMITLDGRTQCQTDWARERGISPGLVSWRISSGYSVEDALQKRRLPRRSRSI